MLPFIDYILNEDKTIYPFASEVTNFRSKQKFIDPDLDFRMGNSGGFLMNIDFVVKNTNVYTKVANTFLKNKLDPNVKELVNSIRPVDVPNRNMYYYNTDLMGTPQFHDFWQRETIRRKAGMVANCKLYMKDIDKYDNALSQKDRDALLYPLRITGDHYHFLNYGRLRRTPNALEIIDLINKGEIITDVLIDGFPRFQDGQYWNFKSTEFAQRNRYNIFKGKARGKGYSFITGNGDANLLNLFPKTTVVLLAYEDKFLIDGEEGTAVMLKTAIDWMEANTYWRRGVAKELVDHLILGVKPTGSNEIIGWRSRALSFPIKTNESAGIGKRARRIRFEEAGYCANLQKALDVTLSSTQVGMGTVGYIEVYGTAGTKTENWLPFANGFFNPDANKAMPFENVHDINSRQHTCGFFHPQIWNLEPYMDVDGNSLLLEAYEADMEDKVLAEVSKPLSDYIVYVGQRANTPAEAFRGGVENIFSSPDLDYHVKSIENDPLAQYYRDGMIIDEGGKDVFKTNGQLKELNQTKLIHPYIETVPFSPKDDLYGCLRMYYPPFKNADGVIPDNLYVILADPVRKDKDNKTLSAKNSLNSFYVVMLPNNVSNSAGDIIVAAYSGRPSQMEEANKILLRMCRYYNAKTLVEVTVGTIISDFKTWNAKKWLLRDPSTVIDRNIKENDNAPFGVQIESTKDAEDALINLKDWMYGKVGIEENTDRQLYKFSNIRDLPLLREFKQFNEKGNYDRISAMRLYPIARAYHQITRKTAKTITEKSVFRKIGLYGIGQNA
jgi:hypothetical protein